MSRKLGGKRGKAETLFKYITKMSREKEKALEYNNKP